ncbi:MerR family DNA-binding transcriptional regulator [Nocardiopsis alba]|jgi:predicted site-specific integrase-resolvase|uniref:MerR family DNA-binding transcriptional regulator n=1 Tax=Nocardiopsis alba TaxID=53437 RepID=UPI0036555838
MTQPDADPMNLLIPQEVVQASRVDSETLRLCTQEGRSRWVRTLGGHRRYFKADVQRLLKEPGR